MSDQQHHSTCEHHFTLVTQVNDMLSDQKDFQKHQTEWMERLEQQQSNFINEIDQEIRGGKGPEGKPGMKQIMHDNKNDIAELKRQEINWPQIIGTVISTVVAAILIFLLIKQQGG